ncbi:DUF5926 family protein [Ornithinimicrobium sediminis]|uniref:DUF5926 family protein n=1 Tax=Ornithinimicrobium sediminis TaxID=2904603 RepID=UPI001E333F70|nr:DUF5926 family protein [Ornithinimicrobium sediminis]MCE0486819.1 DUF5926 family protein [Ornithinimicrobium sediminis]
MGKASRRKRASGTSTVDPAQQRAPFVARPFEGLADETEWVAMREIIPSATARITVTLPEGAAQEVTLATVLPGAMPALHRADGEVLVALQSRTSSGDASRDIAQALLVAVAAEPGSPVTSVRPATMGTPRLQDMVSPDQRLEPTVHEDFSFWVAEDEATPEVAAALEQTNDAAVPTVRLEELPSAYWCRMGERTYIRWILGDDEDAAVTALARLQAAGQHTLGAGTVLLGAFRAAGLLVPVLEVPADTAPTDHTEALLALQQRYEEAITRDEPLTPDERRARDGIISRQVTLR